MSKLSKKLFISVFTLVLTVMAMVATTYAWFTLGDTATVGNINASVQGGEGLDISLDGTNWYSNISEARFEKYYVDTESNSTTLRGVTSNNGRDFYALDGVTYDNGDDKFIFSPTVNHTLGGYIEFELHFRTPEDGPTTIYLKDILLDGTLGEWIADVDHTATNGDEKEAFDGTGTPGAKNEIMSAAHWGARVSVTNVTKDIDENDVVKTFMYELGGEEDGGESTSTHVNSNGQFKANGAHDYFLQKGNELLGFGEDYESDDLDELLKKLYLTGYNDTKTNFVDNGEYRFSFDLVEEGAWNVGSVTIRIWIEGFDADSYNAIMDKEFSTLLTFTLDGTVVTP